MRVVLAATLMLISLFCCEASNARRVNSVGTDYIPYSAPGLVFNPSTPHNYYVPGHQLLIPVGLYDLNPPLVNSQLSAMRASGQTDVVFVLYPHDLSVLETPAAGANYDGYPDGVWGETLDDSTGQMLPAHQQQFRQILSKVVSLGFKRVIVRFNHYWPITSGQQFSEQLYQHSWGFIVSTRGLVDGALAGTGIEALFDLGGELAASTAVPGPTGTQAFVHRLWADWISAYGNTETVGFSFAYTPGRFTTMKQWYQSWGPYLPTVWAFDIYPGYPGMPSDMKTALTQISQEMGSLNGQPIIVLETWTNDSVNASYIQDALSDFSTLPNLNLDGVYQWLTNRACGIPSTCAPWSPDSISNLNSSSQISYYQPLISKRRVRITNSNSNAQVVVDDTCGATTTSSCTVTQRWGAPPAGQVEVLSVSTDGGSETVSGCTGTAGSWPVNWIVQGHSYVFKIRYQAACAFNAANPVAGTSTVNVML
jgi:hypothetical protein